MEDETRKSASFDEQSLQQLSVRNGTLRSMALALDPTKLVPDLLELDIKPWFRTVVSRKHARGLVRFDSRGLHDLKGRLPHSRVRSPCLPAGFQLWKTVHSCESVWKHIHPYRQQGIAPDHPSARGRSLQ